MLCRVQHFLKGNAGALGHIPESTAATQVDALVSDMASGAQDAVTSRAMVTGESGNTRVLRRALWVNHMQQIAAIARAELRHIPQFEALILPRVSESTPRVLRRARAMAEVAREHAEMFIEHGLPANFADQLLAAANALEASLQKRAEDRAEAAGAHGRVAASRSRAQYVIRVLNAQIEKALIEDPTLLAQWKYVKRVGFRGVPAAEEVTPGQAATTQSAGTAPAAPLAVVGQQQTAAAS